MNGLAAVLILATLIGSAIFGWTYHPWWLVVPPIVFIALTTLLSADTVKLEGLHGIGVKKWLAKEITPTSFLFALLNMGLATAVFAAAWLLHSLL